MAGYIPYLLGLLHSDFYYTFFLFLTKLFPFHGSFVKAVGLSIGYFGMIYPPICLAAIIYFYRSHDENVCRLNEKLEVE